DRNVTGVQTCALPIFIPMPLTSSYRFSYTIISAQWHRDDEENIAINVFGLSHFCVSRAKLPQVDGVFFSVRSSSHIFSLPLISPSNSRKRSEEHTSELQSRFDLVCRLLLE